MVDRHTVHRLEFAAGAALSLASNTETVDLGAVTQHFCLRYTPNNWIDAGLRWSVAVVTTQELPNATEASASSSFSLSGLLNSMASAG